MMLWCDATESLIYVLAQLYMEDTIDQLRSSIWKTK
jgi:hypothetical protein